MDAYLPKPIESDALYETIDRLTGRTAHPNPDQEPSANVNAVRPAFDMDAATKSLGGDRELVFEIAAIFLAQALL